MSKKFIFLLVIFFFLSCPPRTTQELTKVGCVDIQKVFESVKGKGDAEKLLQIKREQLIKEKKQKEEELQKLLDEYEAQKANISDIEKTLKENLIATKKIELEKFIDESNTILAQTEEDLLTPILKKIRTAIETICNKRGFNLIVDKATYVLYHEKGLDITEEVIKELKKMEEEE